MFVWCIRFQRWALYQHVLAAGLLLVCLGLAGWAYVYRAAIRLQHVQQESQVLQTQWDTAQRKDSQSVKPDFTQTLPRMARADEVTRDIGRFADSLGVRIVSLSVDSRAASSTELGKVQFNLSAQADYKAGKAWLSELLARYSSLAVQSLLMRSEANAALRQDMRVTLVLWVQD